MSDNDEDRSSLSKAISGILSSTYYALVILATCIGLVVWTMKQEARLSAIEHENILQNQRIEDFDTKGTRALSERVSILIAQINTLETRLNAGDQRTLDLLNSHTAAINDRITNILARLNSWDLEIRKISIVEARQAEVYRRLDNIEKRDDLMQQQLQQRGERK